MTTPTIAQAALITVAQAYWTANAADPTWGVMYRTTKFVNTYPINAFVGPKIAIYRAGGTSTEQGIGTVKQWSDTRFKVDVIGRNFAEAEQMCNALGNAWEGDFDWYVPNPVPTPGQAYLKVVGGLKDLDLGNFQAMDNERQSGAWFRRLTDLTVTIGDSPTVQPTTYQSAVTNIANCIAYWPLSEASGSAIDVVGARNGTYSNCTLAALLAPGSTMGKAPQFDGSSSTVQFPSSTLNGVWNSQKGTLSIWANLSATWNDFSQRTPVVIGTDFSNSVQIFKNGSGVYTVSGFYEQNSVSVFANASYALTGWHHYAVTWDTTAGQLLFYIDGVKQGSAQAITSGYTGALQDGFCRLGNRSGGNYWQGWLSGCALFARALTATEIVTLATAF